MITEQLREELIGIPFRHFERSLGNDIFIQGDIAAPGFCINYGNSAVRNPDGSRVRACVVVRDKEHQEYANIADALRYFASILHDVTDLKVDTKLRIACFEVSERGRN